MKIRTLLVSILGIVVVAGVSPAEETATPAPELLERVSAEPSPPDLLTESSFARAAEPPSVSAPRPTSSQSSTTRSRSSTTSSQRRGTFQVARTRDSESPTQVQIFPLEHASVMDMSELISRVFNINAPADRRTNSLIINATREQMDDIENLIRAMDVPGSEASMQQETRDYIYRIYMFEISSDDDNMKSFSIRIQSPELVSSQELEIFTEDKNVRICELVQNEAEGGKRENEILIQGKATSDENLMNAVSKMQKINVIELKWEDAETFTNKLAAADFSRLPEQMQKHIGNLLGNDIRTIGYWFGNLSAPGGVMAPIGPWMMNLSVGTESDRMLDFQIDVEIPGQMHISRRPLGTRNDRILSNTLRAKIGKPIIIGYNRESYGTRKMGAMVIVPEADSFSSESENAGR